MVVLQRSEDFEPAIADGSVTCARPAIGLTSLSGSVVYILGISAFYHDSAACLVRDGDIVAAAQEERFTRKKGDDAFPSEAVAYCLGEAGIDVADLVLVAFFDKPLLKF